jgi:hypothetical protein
MAETKNTFLKGKMNKDLDSRIVPNGEYREARNLSISRSEGSKVGEFENILGNTAISSLTAIGASATTEIIGKFIDENSNAGYFFATDFGNADPTIRATAADNCYIVKVNLNVAVVTNPVILVQGFFLNFNKNFPITGVNLVEDLLFFTDNLNQPRKINVTRALASATYYDSEANISVAKYAPYEPILVMERLQARIQKSGGYVSATVIDVNQTEFDKIQVGDILTDRNKITGQQITGLVTIISKAPKGNPVQQNKAILTLSSPITIDDNVALDISRPSMTNKQDFEMSNHSSGAVTIVGGGTPNPITATYTIGPGNRNNIVEGPFIYGGKNGIPRIGDLVSGDGVSADTRVASVNVVNQYQNPPSLTDLERFETFQEITVTLDKTTTMSTNDSISISDNPDYDAAWNGDEKILEDKFVRFSYRFKFDDNEYSLIAPFSQAMFIPKQYGEFGGGTFSDKEDMDNAYTSTIVNWFENNINNILLKIPMVKSTPQLTIDDLHISKVDILYKESDALAVKVLETIDLQSLVDQSTNFSSISFEDAIHSSATENPAGSGNYDINTITEYFLDYDYSSIKPYKTLPNNQITRVSDKVPIKALGQEIIGNRVVYGNYLDRHTSPASIDYSAYASNKSTNFDNYTQFPKHQLKQDRTYQVGFILSDYYGRQSDVILSSRDGTALAGSTVFNPYNDLTTQQQVPILNWLGNALNVTLYTAITPLLPTDDGSPGIYNEITNPLGWFSYKIVVKQKQQEYYNVYLPGFVNGYPIATNINSERNISFFSTLQGDNVNKVPRDLNEVGPNDREFTTSENLLIRVNNPFINNKTEDVSAYNKDRAWNAQYYPGNLQQEILQIGTVRDLEIQAIPFKADAPAGEYGESSILQTYNYIGDDPANAIENVNEVPEPTGAIPWGTTGPDASFYNGDSNPFVFKGDQSQNKNNPIGAIVTINSVNDIPPVTAGLSMVPFLSVAETKPVESLLDIFWETSLSGNLVNLNSLVPTQSDGITGSNFEAANFPESILAGERVGFGFNFLNGVGQFIPASQITVNSITITDGTPSALGAIFTLTKNIQQTAFEIKATAADFFYSDAIAATPLTGVFIITANVTFNGEDPLNITLAPLTLTNVAPTIDSFTQPTPTAAVGNIITLTGKNGSADTSVNTTQLNWSIVSISPIEDPVKIQINATTGVLSNDAILSDATFYSVEVKATDVSGNGLDSLTSFVNFQIGSAASNRVNAALCQGWQGSNFTGCGESLGVIFGSSKFSDLAVPTSSVVVDNAGGATSVTYPSNGAGNGSPSTGGSYNVFARNPSTFNEFTTPQTVTHTTGALTQGTLYITPTLINVAGSGSEDDTITFTIQIKSGSAWVQAVTSSTATPASETIRNITLQVGANSTVDSKKIFDVPGQYRVLTTNITGGMCSLGQTGTSFRVNFGDENFSNCTGAPA